ncbi:hypothetical protein CEV08_02805 [Bartonella tribocorum]|uniref:Uncharacterized protein n=1 Tax=Bartonella tribocorum TaxID=85701 RepID=A0A2M6UWV9_9HYPH|nr:hypothetical protein CEV08_02805 [Bartonella tribocorum]
MNKAVFWGSWGNKIFFLSYILLFFKAVISLKKLKRFVVFTVKDKKWDSRKKLTHPNFKLFVGVFCCLF